MQSNTTEIKNRINQLQPKKITNPNLEVPLTLRKEVTQEINPKYLNNRKDKEETINLKRPTYHIPYVEKLPNPDNQLHRIKQKIEHTPIVFQQLLDKTVIKAKSKNHQIKNKHKRRNKKKKRIILTKYWNNKAPLLSLGKNAEILKKSLRKGKTKTKIILPETVKKKILADFKNHHLLNPNYWSQIVEHWLSLSAKSRQKSIDALLRPITINNSDPRKKLHGQYGVLAARDISPYSVIAPYSGVYCIGSDILKEKAFYGTNVGRYAVDCSIDNMQIDLCAYGHGNITLCINANTTYSKDEPVLNDNACFALIIYQGWPYIFVISISEIQKNAEVLIDYGQYYWKGR
ncbi:hypothetical protein GV64_16235 [Endozoicomonas elysicola]|uniref:SET domain-containing protein n=1 Tax=Endozoicomonas elysicola TaxID=305900 RepID=A0A081KD42_9GAMM|nr:hypothetical protein GV64_16235 [Endozoicomonas elysicola]